MLVEYLGAGVVARRRCGIASGGVDVGLLGVNCLQRRGHLLRLRQLRAAICGLCLLRRGGGFLDVSRARACLKIAQRSQRLKVLRNGGLIGGAFLAVVEPDDDLARGDSLAVTCAHRRHATADRAADRR